MSDIISGYYFYDGITLQKANGVCHQDFELTRENHLEWTYPVRDWYWFETEEEARIFFNMPTIEEEQEAREYAAFLASKRGN